MSLVDLRQTWDSLAELRTVESESVDGVITDPPYSSGGQFRGDRMDSAAVKYERGDQTLKRATFTGDNRDQRSYAYWCALWLSEALRIAKPGAPIVLFSDWRQLPSTTDALQAGGWVWRGIAPWDKTEGARPQRGRFRAQCEFMVWGSKGPMAEERGVEALPGCFRYVVLQSDKYHLAGKPTALMRDVVRITAPGGIILDPFMGSGTTGVAAAIGGYGFIGMEHDEANVIIARRRIDEAQHITPENATQFGLGLAGGGGYLKMHKLIMGIAA